MEFAEVRLEEGNKRVWTRGMQDRMKAEEVWMRKERVDWMGQGSQLDMRDVQREESRMTHRCLAWAAVQMGMVLTEIKVLEGSKFLVEENRSSFRHNESEVPENLPMSNR